MSTVIADLKADRDRAISKADAILATAERARRPLSAIENGLVESATSEARSLNAEIERVAKVKALRAQFPAMALHEVPRTVEGGEPLAPKHFSSEYPSQFLRYISSGGTSIGAALYESSSPAGGYAVPITVDDQIVPLAPQDLAVRNLATVVPTKADRLIPQKSTFGAAALTPETTGFAGSTPTLSQVLLSAFAVGTLAQCSVEILQDIGEFEAFVLDDISLDIQQLEESWFINGTGSGQAQGLIGNVGAGVTEEPDSNGNLVSISGTLDLVGSLRATYYPNATWLMSRGTAIGVRKAQLQTNAYEPVWTRIGNQDFLHGFPVAFSESMPSAQRGHAPVLFGDFKRGYVIGDRGGAAVRLKVIDQSSLALQGLVGLLGYRRTDGRVRRSEAIQQYNVAAS